MKLDKASRLVTVFSVVVALVVGSLGSQLAVADIVGTETLLQEQNGTITRDELQSLIARGDVQQQLIEYGISPEEASDRVAALTDTELQHLSQHMDDEPAGGSVTLILLIIILIILLR
ncbi:MAG: PA2779 family protein [Saccharospirillum sp.]|uniref:PA2779 family protein n=1 Tax=Saccharospirillum sp. TaxID=2033801 RepID=UPI003299E530